MGFSLQMWDLKQALVVDLLNLNIVLASKCGI